MVPSQRKPPRVEPDEQFSDEEAMRRMNEVVKRMGNTPPKPHSAMKVGKHKAKADAKANWPGKAPLQFDRVRMWKILSGLIVAPYSQIVPRATLTSSSLSSRSRLGSAPLDAEGGKPSLAEK
jgi:hypothetical protein